MTPKQRPDVPKSNRPHSLPAGRFSAWLRATRGALKRGAGADVPCGECIACCRAAYFIHIRPQETQTLRRIPEKLLCPAPGLPAGHRLLGHFEDGRCPMLANGRCSIYTARPRTCRHYDCRIFAAAGIPAGGAEKAEIARQVRRWRFGFPAAADRRQRAAIRAAARFIRTHARRFPAGTAPGNATQLAVLAVKTYGVFLRGSSDSVSGRIRKILSAAERFSQGG